MYVFKALPGTHPVSILEATGCKWPIGEHPTMYCDATVHKDLASYCTAHSKIAYVPRHERKKGGL